MQVARLLSFTLSSFRPHVPSLLRSFQLFSQENHPELYCRQAHAAPGRP